MDDRERFKRALEALNTAALQDAGWPEASAAIDEAIGATGSAMALGEGSVNAARFSLVGIFERGERRAELEREYLEDWVQRDERRERFRQLPIGHVARIRELFSEEEQRSSPTYNEWVRRLSHQAGLSVRLPGPPGCSHVAWIIGDPVASRDWDSARIGMVRRLLSHVEQFVRVRHTLIGAGVLNASLTELLEARQLGVIHLDREGRVVELNDRARMMVAQGDLLADRGGSLTARKAADRERLQSLLAGALPSSSSTGVGGWTTITRSVGESRFLVHVTPTRAPEIDFVGRRVAAVVLIVEPGGHPRVDPVLVSEVLGLTPTEGKVAAWLAGGRTVSEIAATMGVKPPSIHWHLYRIYVKLGISRQAELVRLVLTLAGFS